MGPVVYDISRSLFELILKGLFDPLILGRENLPEPPFVIASNHGSNADPAIIGTLCRRYRVDFMAKQELFEIPVVGRWAISVGAIPVARGQNSVRGIKEALRRLKAGRIVAFFPEGTRSVDGFIGEARPGTGFLIKKAGVPIVPVYISGSHQVWPKGDTLRPGVPLAAIAGEAVMPSDLPSVCEDPREVYSRAADLIMDRISGLKTRVEKMDSFTPVENTG
ncbi:MAG: hypothetical protein GF392_03865 [Candidatus Omnitrophica bacterium]|nr:hypothetical protein [Candidatus Omnitrophota bacterium]